MPATIQLGMLPPPHLVLVRDDSTLRISSVGRMPFHRRPDPDVLPRMFALSWRWPPSAVADAIARHYDEHPNGVFTITLRTGEQVRVQLLGRPNIQWSSAAFAESVSAEAAEVLAYD